MTSRAPGQPSTEDVVHPERGDGPRQMRIHRAVYGATSIGLTLLLILALLDAREPVLGVDSATVRTTAPDGTLLVVEYPRVTRPALASPLAIEVISADGFDGAVEIAISRPWIEVWDENGFYPSPSSEIGERDWVVYEFDPPETTVFRAFYDARMEPARQESVSGEVELRDDGAAVASVSFHTSVRL